MGRALVSQPSGERTVYAGVKKRANGAARSHVGLTAIDLFSGAGGLSLGLRKAGFSLVGAVEFDSLAADTYRRNNPDTTLWECDIRELSPRLVARTLELKRGELDLLAACPPCQGFSTVRTLNGAQPVEDERNDLVADVGRFAASLLPKAVMVENVPGLRTDERRDALYLRLRKLGYEVRDQILDASEFGVAQRRSRYILIAVRGATPRFARRARIRPTVREIIGGLPAAGTSGDPLHDHGEQRSAEVLRRIRLIPSDGGGRSDLPEREQLDCHRRCDGFKDVYGRMAWGQVAPTITGGCINPSKGRFLHPEADRSITLREAAMLQGFPRRYYFSLKRGKYAAAQMVGNALPPPFIERHARQIARTVNALDDDIRA